MEYSRQVQVFGILVFELLSEALGLKSDYLESMDCAKGQQILSHYYRPCPQPQLTMGIKFEKLISNDIFKSVQHRVLANRHKSSRVSVECFFTLGLHPTTKVYGPVKELLSKDNSPVYRETSLKEFVTYYHNKGFDENSALSHFKLQHVAEIST
ncbi:1-aminocyclopropane-1-carboxylate oxidase homolog 3-like [Cicer arietinum]|uniref:1-aminocyclopropane-1-carboxylate oxidase homolog 3-like n=1 Tax=Cicer arietinum TaxID=3827 RepID=UPI003CC65987